MSVRLLLNGDGSIVKEDPITAVKGEGTPERERRTVQNALVNGYERSFKPQGWPLGMSCFLTRESPATPWLGMLRG